MNTLDIDKIKKERKQIGLTQLCYALSCFKPKSAVTQAKHSY